MKQPAHPGRRHDCGQAGIVVWIEAGERVGLARAAACRTEERPHQPLAIHGVQRKAIDVDEQRDQKGPADQGRHHGQVRPHGDGGVVQV